jgi:hypothetical protein
MSWLSSCSTILKAAFFFLHKAHSLLGRPARFGQIRVIDPLMFFSRNSAKL